MWNVNNIYLIVWFSCWNQLSCQDLISSHLLLIMYVTGVCMTGPLMQPSVSKIKMKALPAIHICHHQSRSCASPLSTRKCAGTAFVSGCLRHSVLNDESVTRKGLTYTITQLERCFLLKYYYFLHWPNAIIWADPFLPCTQVVNVYQCVA